MSNLSDIGFPARGDQEIYELIQKVLPYVATNPCSRGFYYAFTDESGAEIYLQANIGQELVGFNPHFAGKSRRKVTLTAAVERESSELDGGFKASAKTTESDDENSGDYSFVFDVPDFLTVGEIDFPQVVEIQLTAFASNDFKIYDDENDFLKSREEAENKLDAKTFIPGGQFAEAEDKESPPRPIAMIIGEIKEYELRTNKMSGENFYWFLAETSGGEIDVVADPKLLPDEPQLGGIIRGNFWLSGKIL
ncbi:MAG: hypothetical protein ACR2L1_06915 [Pyrinomonadaceae bacterium]